jgi:metacaspase-1
VRPRELAPGDMFLVSYSGHGGQVPDVNGDEDDYKDETWCLYDGQVIDDELNVRYAKLAADVRVLVFSDSCHSGTVTRGEAEALADQPMPGLNIGEDGFVYRAMPPTANVLAYRARSAFYDDLQRAVPANVRATVVANVRLISGCQDRQLSRDGRVNGLFTAAMLGVWNGGKFDGDYAAFAKAIAGKMPSDQQPNHFVIGPKNAAYDRQKPFTI